MSGTIFGLPLSQQFTVNGVPMSGARLYLYLASTTTPAVAYQDFGLTTGLELPWPMLADSNGRIPQFWLADGSYRARLTDALGTVQFDIPEIQAIGASSGAGGGGGVDANAILQTGDQMWQAKSGTRAGWVRDNARTVGSATSGATERANADCEALFTFYYNTYSDTLCPVVGGRGANAAADWAANKQITTLDMQGVAAVGMVGMGGTDNGTLDNVTFAIGSKTTAASRGGSAFHALTSAENGPHTHTTVDHTHFLEFTGNTTVSSGANATVPSTGGPFGDGNGTGIGFTDPTNVTVNSSGSGTPHENMQPFVLGTWYRKL